jgi:hypothetical protein
MLRFGIVREASGKSGMVRDCTDTFGACFFFGFKKNLLFLFLSKMRDLLYTNVLALKQSLFGLNIKVLLLKEFDIARTLAVRLYKTLVTQGL